MMFSELAIGFLSLVQDAGGANSLSGAEWVAIFAALATLITTIGTVAISVITAINKGTDAKKDQTQAIRDQTTVISNGTGNGHN